MHFLTIVQGPKLKVPCLYDNVKVWAITVRLIGLAPMHLHRHCYADEVRAGEILVMG